MRGRGLGLILAAASPMAAVALAAAPPVPGRSTQDIANDFKGTERQIESVQHTDRQKYDPALRKDMLAAYGSLYAEQERLVKEYAAAVPKQAAASRHRVTVDDACLAFWGDPAARTRLDVAKDDRDKAVAADARLGQFLVDWWNAAGDADNQSLVLYAVEPMVAATPTSDDVADTLRRMLDSGPATVAIGRRMTDDLVRKMVRTPTSKAYAAKPNKIDEPLVIAGPTLKGPIFKSSAWAGKVVLVQFWATMSPTCASQTAAVAKAYSDYHDQGLEVIGVSCEGDKDALATFVKQHPEVTWPQLSHAGGGLHPLVKSFGIERWPTVYLIDRAGNLRSTDAESHLDAEVPPLLAEAYTRSGARPAAAARPAPVPTPTGAAPASDINDLTHHAAGATMH